MFSVPAIPAAINSRATSLIGRGGQAAVWIRSYPWTILSGSPNDTVRTAALQFVQGEAKAQVEIELRAGSRVCELRAAGDPRQVSRSGPLTFSPELPPAHQFPYRTWNWSTSGTSLTHLLGHGQSGGSGFHPRPGPPWCIATSSASGISTWTTSSTSRSMSRQRSRFHLSETGAHARQSE